MKLFTCNVTGEGGRDKKNAMALKEIYSDEEPNDGGRQLLMVLPYETTPSAMDTCPCNIPTRYHSNRPLPCPIQDRHV